MALELAEVATGLPMAFSLALAGGITTLRESRRRSALNEAMHELRRPLQALSLALPADSARVGSLESSLRMAAVALERLDREINGVGEVGARDPVDVEALMRAAAGRWRAQLARQGRSLRVRFDRLQPFVQGDAVALAQAVDNLINNAIEHGRGEVALEVREVERRACLAIIDEGPRSADGRPRSGLRTRLGGRCRHGHGLRVVGRVAREHGGAFRLQRSRTGTEARLELPLLRREARA